MNGNGLTFLKDDILYVNPAIKDRPDIPINAPKTIFLLI